MLQTRVQYVLLPYSHQTLKLGCRSLKATHFMRRLQHLVSQVHSGTQLNVVVGDILGKDCERLASGCIECLVSTKLSVAHHI